MLTASNPFEDLHPEPLLPSWVYVVFYVTLAVLAVGFTTIYLLRRSTDARNGMFRVRIEWDRGRGGSTLLAHRDEDFSWRTLLFGLFGTVRRDRPSGQMYCAFPTLAAAKKAAERAVNVGVDQTGRKVTGRVTAVVEQRSHGEWSALEDRVR